MSYSIEFLQCERLWLICWACHTSCLVGHWWWPTNGSPAEIIPTFTFPVHMLFQDPESILGVQIVFLKYGNIMLHVCSDHWMWLLTFSEIFFGLKGAWGWVEGAWDWVEGAGGLMSLAYAGRSLLNLVMAEKPYFKENLNGGCESATLQRQIWEILNPCSESFSGC